MHKALIHVGREVLAVGQSVAEVSAAIPPEGHERMLQQAFTRLPGQAFCRGDYVVVDATPELVQAFERDGRLAYARLLWLDSHTVDLNIEMEALSWQVDNLKWELGERG